jgi:hypothetical protein
MREYDEIGLRVGDKVTIEIKKSDSSGGIWYNYELQLLLFTVLNHLLSICNFSNFPIIKFFISIIIINNWTIKLNNLPKGVIH